MPKKLDEKVVELLKVHGYGKEAVWDCHGTWVVYHKVLEDIANKEGITFQSPHVCCSDLGNIAICVHGELRDKIEWSIGEASPKNNKNSYPWAMAEKRGKDRVILKLIGLHGLVYSEQEADEFKEERPDAVKGNKVRAKEAMKEFEKEVFATEDLDTYDLFVESKKNLLNRFEEVIPEWYEGLQNDMREHRRKLENI